MNRTVEATETLPDNHRRNSRPTDPKTKPSSDVRKPSESQIESSTELSASSSEMNSHSNPFIAPSSDGSARRKASTVQGRRSTGQTTSRRRRAAQTAVRPLPDQSSNTTATSHSSKPSISPSPVSTSPLPSSSEIDIPEPPPEEDQSTNIPSSVVLEDLREMPPHLNVPEKGEWVKPKLGNIELEVIRKGKISGKKAEIKSEWN